MPLGVLIWFLFFLGYSPGKAALYSAGAAYVLHLVRNWLPLAPLAILLSALSWLVLHFLGHPTANAVPYAAGIACLVYWMLAPPGRPRLDFIWDVAIKSGQILIPVLLVCGIAGIIIGTINITGLGFSLTLALGKIASHGGVFALLVATAVMAIILGVGMPTTGVYIIVAVLLAPALVRANIAEMSAHLFIFYFGLLSMLTPPVAIASYSASTIAESDMWQTGITGVRLAIVAYLLPFVFAFNPALLLDGTWTAIVVSCVTVTVAGILLAEVLASRRAYGGGLLRWAALVLSIVIGGSTAVLIADSLPAIVIAVLSVPIAYGFGRFARFPSPVPISANAAPSQQQN